MTRTKHFCDYHLSFSLMPYQLINKPRYLFRRASRPGPRETMKRTQAGMGAALIPLIFMHDKDKVNNSHNSC